MNFETKINEWISELKQKLEEQVWYQDLKNRWDALEPQAQSAISYGVMAGSSLIVFLVFLGIYSNVKDHRVTYEDNLELLNSLQTAADEIRELELATGPAKESSDSIEWQQFLADSAQRAGIDPEASSIKSTRRIDNDLVDEKRLEIEVNHIDAQQLTQLAFYLENGSAPLRLRHLKVHSEGEEEGFMSATMVASAFEIDEES